MSFIYSPFIYTATGDTFSFEQALELLFSGSLRLSVVVVVVVVVVVCPRPVKEAASAPIDGITALDFSHPPCSALQCCAEVLFMSWDVDGINKLKTITLPNFKSQKNVPGFTP